MGAVKISLMNGKDKVILPVTPESFSVKDTWSNEELSINKLGLITMIGKRGLRSITISSFLPKQPYDFLVSGGTTSATYTAASSIKRGEKEGQKKVTATYHPWNTIKQLQSWRGKVLTLFISDTEKRVSWPCVIDGDFTYGMSDASGDVDYTLTLKEYKRTNTERTVKKPKSYKYTTKKDDTLNKISKKLTGATKYAKTLYKQNKKKCSKGFKKYLKKLKGKKKQAAYKKKSKYNKQLPKGIKLVLKIKI